MVSKETGGEIGDIDEESKGSRSEQEWEGNEDEAKETVKAMMASGSRGEGKYLSNNTTVNTDTGEGSKRKKEAVESTPDGKNGGDGDGCPNDPTQESERTRGPESKRKKKDIADFFKKNQGSKGIFQMGSNQG